ncbi:MAG: glutamine--fructose-6-phosphate transaminase (isomerizing) [Coriobacteriia bacterium]|nr:glutamine--fructose-6-phosphate transaminase (isomerizing) [Coriobacteriia bacterium]
MCGIVGYVGYRQASDVLLAGLARLEYRGYDSAGLAIIDNGVLDVRRRDGKLINLIEDIEAVPLIGTVGIGHTRWATHGRPCVKNAHPHCDCTGDIAVVHNGIVENYQELRDELKSRGHEFLSETDTETIAHLIEEYYEGDLVSAVAKTLKRLEGAFAITVVDNNEPDRIVAARKDSPLIIGAGVDENIVASDIPAVLEYTREVVVLHDYELALVTAEDITVYDLDLNVLEAEMIHVEWDLAAAEKGGFADFMLKEINEQPHAIRETLRGRYMNGQIQLSELDMSAEEIKAIERVFIIACGTSYNAGLVAKTLIERWTHIPVQIEFSSEFRYGEAIVDERTLVVAITQSGETADTLAGLREARSKGAKGISITNVVGSRVTRESDGVIYTHAGPEIGVAATKTFTAQIVALTVLGLKLAQTKETLSSAEIAGVIAELNTMPDVVQEILDGQSDIQECASEFVGVSSSLFLGRGVGVAIAMEGALKLKEISYIHAEAYASGEMKHGPIALITNEVPVVAVAVDSPTYEKVISNIEEVRARDARVILVATQGNTEAQRHADHVLYVPETSEFMSAIASTIPLQLLAYYIAKMRGCNVDQPRNLAKSVTVE